MYICWDCKASTLPISGRETPMITQSNELTVEAYVRPQQLMEPIDSKIKMLHRLESRNSIENLAVHAWPGRIILSEQTPYTEAINAFEQMEAWASEHGFSIQPPFSVQTTTSGFTGETQTKLRTPIMCLAIYVDDQLVNVFPHSRSDDQYSVSDAIVSLRTDSLEMFSLETDLAASSPDHCSECEERLMNVQGIRVCQNCDRVETRTRSRKQQSLYSRFAHHA
jgi:hypothetical protein